MAVITTAEDAIETGDVFLSKYYPFKRPLSAKIEEENWLVVFDVGAIKVQRVGLKIDANTGAILEVDDLSNHDT